jgi:hypothetical protein
MPRVRVRVYNIIFQYRVPNHTRAHIISYVYIVCVRRNFEPSLCNTRRRHKRHNSNPGKGGGFKSRLELGKQKKNNNNKPHELYLFVCVTSERFVLYIYNIG